MKKELLQYLDDQYRELMVIKSQAIDSRNEVQKTIDAISEKMTLIQKHQLRIFKEIEEQKKNEKK